MSRPQKQGKNNANLDQESSLEPSKTELFESKFYFFDFSEKIENTLTKTFPPSKKGLKRPILTVF